VSVDCVADCVRDYTAPCPFGWIAVSERGCTAPPTYPGTACAVVADFRDYDRAMKEVPSSRSSHLARTALAVSWLTNARVLQSIACADLVARVQRFLAVPRGRVHTCAHSRPGGPGY
jgi:CPW-WPC domain-containing protein